MKTFNKRFNAQRAAKSQLKNQKAVEGADFVTFKSGDGWAFRMPGVIERGTAKSPSKKRQKAEGQESKSAQLVARASSKTGITNAEIRELTGWKKCGGFFGAVKRAGLKLRSVKEGNDTRWFAEAA